MKIFIAFLVTVAVWAKPWMRLSDTPQQRAAALLQEMNLTEKIDLLHGVGSPHYTGLTLANQRLGIPALTLNDGRQGFRPSEFNGRVTPPCVPGI